MFGLVYRVFRIMRSSLRLGKTQAGRLPPMKTGARAAGTKHQVARMH